MESRSHVVWDFVPDLIDIITRFDYTSGYSFRVKGETPYDKIFYFFLQDGKIINPFQDNLNIRLLPPLDTRLTFDLSQVLSKPSPYETASIFQVQTEICTGDGSLPVGKPFICFINRVKF